MKSELSELLYKPFENIPTRKGRGGVYPYIRWQDVADRMNEVFGTNWSSEVLFQDIIGANVIVRVRVSIIDSEKGIFFTQEGFGGAPNDANNEAGNPFKAAYSKALKDACKKWGVGLYLDDDDESVSGGVSQHTPPSGYMGREVGVPPTPPVKEQTPVFTPSVTESVVPSVPMDDSYTKVVSSIPAVPTGGMPLPPGVAMNSKVLPVSNPSGNPLPNTPFPEFPTPPTAPPASKSISLKEDMPMSKGGTINTGEPDYISDVQRAALQSILSIKGVDYEPLAKEAFEFNEYVKSPVPDPDKLTYQEAVYVIKFGNDKFRKR